MDFRATFEQAWADPRNTAVDLPPVDVNQVLRDRYHLEPELLYTRTMLWDMEVRKASAPDVYIPSAVLPGSVAKWESGVPNEFTRVSEQRLWLKPDESGLIIEHVRLDPGQQSVLFIGVAEHTTPEGRDLHATTGQPLFHVEHWVEGEEDQPINRWKIVHLTSEPDQAILDFFTAMGENAFLRDFIEVHIRQVHGRTLTRRV
jgi:hypothetical protein